MPLQTGENLLVILNICLDAVIVLLFLLIDSILEINNIEIWNGIFKMSASFFGMLIIAVRFYFLLKDKINNKKSKKNSN